MAQLFQYSNPFSFMFDWGGNIEFISEETLPPLHLIGFVAAKMKRLLGASLSASSPGFFRLPIPVLSRSSPGTPPGFTHCRDPLIPPSHTELQLRVCLENWFFWMRNWNINGGTLVVECSLYRALSILLHTMPGHDSIGLNYHFFCLSSNDEGKAEWFNNFLMFPIHDCQFSEFSA